MGSDMTALEQLGTFVAHTGAQSRLHDVLELHVIDTVGAWIASLSTPEGAALLRWRATLGEGAAPGSMHRLRLDVATHCALARLSEIDDIHLASTTTPGAIVVPGAVAIAAACRNRDPDALAADNQAVAILPRREPVPTHMHSPVGNLFLQKVLDGIREL